MAHDTLTPAAEPLFEPGNAGASLHRIERLVVPIRENLLRGVFPGDVMSPSRGAGSETVTVRDWEPGDEYRSVGHKETAKHPEHTPQVRVTQADIIPSLWLVTDAPQGHNQPKFGEFSKQELGLSVGAAMLLLATRESMPIAMLAINNDQEVLTSRIPAGGRQNTSNIGQSLDGLAQIFDLTAKKKPLSGLLSAAASLATKNVVVVVSDFRDTLRPDDVNYGWEKPLQDLKSRGNDIIAVEVTNPADFEIPSNASRFTVFGGVSWLSRREAQRVADIYKEEAPKQQAAIKAALSGVGAAHVELSTAEPKWFTSLHAQLGALAQRTGKH